VAISKLSLAHDSKPLVRKFSKLAPLQLLAASGAVASFRSRVRFEQEVITPSQKPVQVHRLAGLGYPDTDFIPPALASYSRVYIPLSPRRIFQHEASGQPTLSEYEWTRPLVNSIARFFLTPLTVRLGTVASGMKIMIEMSADNYDCLLSKLSEESAAYATLKNGIASGSNEDRIIQIVCEMTQAMTLLQVARELFPPAAPQLQESIGLARVLRA
jgi:hypothetical protein